MVPISSSTESILNCIILALTVMQQLSARVTGYQQPSNMYSTTVPYVADILNSRHASIHSDWSRLHWSTVHPTEGWFTYVYSHAPIHLEVLTDLSTTTFLLAFRRFASHKSLPQLMVSDNASTYILQLFNSLVLDLEQSCVTWKFIPMKPLVWRVLGK